MEACLGPNNSIAENLSRERIGDMHRCPHGDFIQRCVCTELGEGNKLHVSEKNCIALEKNNVDLQTLTQEDTHVTVDGKRCAVKQCGLYDPVYVKSGAHGYTDHMDRCLEDDHLKVKSDFRLQARQRHCSP